MKKIAKYVTAVGVAVAAFVGIAGTASAGTSPSDADRIRALHNQYRVEVGTPALQWNASLQASAQKWADHMLTTGARDHDPSIKGKIGENLYWSNSEAWGRPAATLDPAAAARSWYTEKGSLGKHYTQMVWRNTTKVGCGVATKSEKQGNTERKQQVVVCRYSPMGNVAGQKPF
jgi:pathogenesis-related protein 1